ncbi:MAG: 50S ribosomal protein L29 [Burkholderiales bacterium]|nr:50S ribosomal protein L29 [Burkholderiales bacterium]
MKSNLKEIKTMDEAELQKELEELLKAQFSLRMQKSHQQLQNTAQIRTTRRNIARVRTLLAQKKAAK